MGLLLFLTNFLLKKFIVILLNRAVSLEFVLGLRRWHCRWVRHLLLLLELGCDEGSFVTVEVLLGGKVVAVLRLALRAELLEEQLCLAAI